MKRAERVIYASPVVRYDRSIFEDGLKRMMKHMVAEVTKCDHWKRLVAQTKGQSPSTILMLIRRNMDDDALTGAWPCGVCDLRARAIQVLHYLNVMVALDKLWPLEHGFDPRVESWWNTLIVKGVGSDQTR